MQEIKTEAIIKPADKNKTYQEGIKQYADSWKKLSQADEWGWDSGLSGDMAQVATEMEEIASQDLDKTSPEVLMELIQKLHRLYIRHHRAIGRGDTSVNQTNTARYHNLVEPLAEFSRNTLEGVLSDNQEIFALNQDRFFIYATNQDEFFDQGIPRENLLKVVATKPRGKVDLTKLVTKVGFYRQKDNTLEVISPVEAIEF